MSERPLTLFSGVKGSGNDIAQGEGDEMVAHDTKGGIEKAEGVSREVGGKPGERVSQTPGWQRLSDAAEETGDGVTPSGYGNREAI